MIIFYGKNRIIWPSVNTVQSQWSLNYMMDRWTEKDLSVALRRYVRSSECIQPEQVYFGYGFGYGGARQPASNHGCIRALTEKFGNKYRWVIYKGNFVDWVIIKCPKHGDQKNKLPILLCVREKYACYWCGVEDCNPGRHIDVCQICNKLGFNLNGNRAHFVSAWHKKELNLFMDGYIREAGARGITITPELMNVIVYYWGMKIYNFH